MINRNELQALARKFRGGRISISEFTNLVLGETPTAPASGADAATIQLPERPDDGHKGDFGRLLMVGGSANMPGAIALSGMAALRIGAGLVTVLTTREAQPVVAGFTPCLMTVGVPSHNGLFSEPVLVELAGRIHDVDVLGIGPGMGRCSIGQTLVSDVYRECPLPVVLDADALNNLADAKLNLRQHAGPRVITPHPGEFRRMIGGEIQVREQLEERAIALAAENALVVVLKGQRTLVTDGKREYRNGSGNAGMATAGSGDVLTGIITGLIGQKMKPFEAARTGCYLHGMAGDRFAANRDSASLIATDLIDEIPQVLAAIKNGVGEV